MSSGLFKKKFKGFAPAQVLDYIEGMQKERFRRENELMNKISQLEDENKALLEKLNAQAETNDSLSKQIEQCELQLKELYDLTNEYAEQSHKAVSASETFAPIVEKVENIKYKINSNSKFDVIIDKLASIGNVIEEAKKFIFNK